MLPLTTDLAQQILALIRMETYSLLGAIQDNKVVLGGSAGSGGGTGEPPAGFVGQLTQSNVTFDTAGSTRACSAGSAGSSSLVDNLDAIRLGIEICDDVIGDRHIDWGTGAGQVSAVDVPFQSSSGSISATDVREAIEEAWLHGGVIAHDHSTAGEGGEIPLASVGNYAAWQMIRGGAGDWETFGAGGAGYAIVSTPVAPGFTQTPTWTGVHTFGAGLTFGGFPGSNVITVPDNMADALEIIDGVAGNEYLGFRTLAQKEVVINEDGADIDFRVETAGSIDALFVQGSDGAIVVAGPSMTVPDGWLLDAGGPNMTFDSSNSHLKISGCSVVLPKTSGNGIKVDNTIPTFGWRDLRAEIRTRGVGSSDPNDATYIGNIKAYAFSVGDEAWIEFHIPHDYVLGTDIHLHYHWSHNSADVTGGSVTWEADVTYAKGHDQAAFAATVNPTLVANASTTQYQHLVSEVQLSASAPSATQIDTDDLEPDGIILARVCLNANNITSDNGVPDPFLHEVDVHYQSTNIATKGKVPDFYA